MIFQKLMKKNKSIKNKIIKILTDLEKRVYSGETIIGDKKKMYWTENGWEEAENEYGKTEIFD